MKYLNLLLVLFGFFFSSVSFANNWYDRGNGGFTVVCPDSSVVLDLFETDINGLVKVHYSSQETALAKAQDIVGRLKGLDPAREALYQTWLQDFFTEVSFVKNANFAPVNDLGLVALPSNCALKQVVFQRNPSVLNSSRYLIDSELWNSIDENQQAALMVHEIIYREFINGTSFETSSERVRHFNALLHSNVLKNWNLKTYLDVLKGLHVSTYTYEGLSFLIGYSDERFNYVASNIEVQEGRILSGTLSTFAAIDLPLLKWNCSTKNAPAALGNVVLAEDGRIKNLKVSAQWLAYSDCLPSFTLAPQFVVVGTEWLFDLHEALIDVKAPAELYNNRELLFGKWSITRRVGLTDVPAEAFFDFDQDSNLRILSLGGSPCLRADHKIVFMPAPEFQQREITFDIKGNLETAIPACF
ncbi:hypothetical protein [Bdellovibrio reynosensis]|uniref:Uncharacterized protein n=1 Tax=Bdellovibrio reynosensis TaxID=2835041 RepID=A0ABY4C6G7_9BACT|nr:hypothetical protein [Bdellovibrio reynosensis]UOF00562.1 hypothetical protein MNR06_12720 [Bdellovibrio reynosensis]